jgi:CTP:molybdopterin cytidylyltransferase MocA
VTAGLVLAAGAGTRVGIDSKLLAELDGRPLLEHAVAAQCAVAALDRVVVVLGSRADEIRAQVDFGRAEVVVCEQWHAGQSASLRCGASALRGADMVIVTLGDMPRIGPHLIARFLDEPPRTRGAVPNTALAVNTELFRDWATPLAGPAREVIYWYFREVPKLTADVGVAEAEKLAAQGQGVQ